MTIQDLHIAIKMELDKGVLSSIPNFTDEQIDYFINSSYLMLINQKFTGNNKLQQAFEDSVKRMSDLKDLVVTVKISGNKSDGGIDNEYSFNISTYSDIMYPVQQVLYFDVITGIKDVRTSVTIKHEDSNKFKYTTNNNPWIPEPVLLYSKDTITAYVDPIDLPRYNDNVELELTYVKQPARLQYWVYDTNGNKLPNLSGDATQIPEVAEHVHLEIVSLAVSMMLDNIESQRVQTQPQITQNRE